MQTEAMTESEGLPYPFGSARDILTALFRQKYVILVVSLVFFAGVVAWVYSEDILYEANGSVILKPGREHIVRSEVGTTQIPAFNENVVKSEISIVTSQDLARRAVAVIGVHKIYPEIWSSPPKNPEKAERAIGTAATNLVSKLTAEQVLGSNVIKITFLHQQPKMAATVVNTLIEFLKEKHLQIFSDPKASFLTKQLQVYQDELQNSEKKLQDFRKKHNLSSPLVEEQSRFLTQRTGLDSDYKTIKNQLQGLAGKIASLDTQMKTILENIPVSTVEEGGDLEKAKADLFALKREEQKLLTKYTETSFPVLNLRKEIDLVVQYILDQQKSERANTIASGKKAMYNVLEKERLATVSEITTLDARANVIALQIKDLDKQIERLDILNEELIGLERQRAADEQNYQLYLAKVEEAKVSEEMDRLKMSNISVVQPATIPVLPAGRPRILKLIIGAIFGIVMGVGIGFIIEYLEGIYTRPDQAGEDLGLPVLASFSQKF
jgi:uncharacterized protein involved in exopolysaccharide biosynthesis